MAINISIGNIDRLNIAGLPDVTFLEQLRGVDPAVLGDIGYGPTADPATVDEALAQQESPTEPRSDTVTEAETIRYQAIAERYEESAVAATARRNFLRNVVMHADKTRMLEGFQTNHQRRPDNLGAASSKQHGEFVMAEESLRSACGTCAVRETCRIAGDLDKWLDFHPYKNGPPGRRRPGSLLPPRVTEPRADFLKALKRDPLVHCDPQKRGSHNAASQQ
jgi:hypothetical protein